MTETPPADRADPQLQALAARALHLAMHDDADRADKLVTRIDREYPGTGVEAACLLWTDTLIAHTGLDTADPATVAGLAFQHADGGEIAGADRVPAGIRWAGRFITARLRMDQDTHTALLRGFCDGYTFGDAVMNLLMVVALNINEHDRGRESFRLVAGHPLAAGDDR